MTSNIIRSWISHTDLDSFVSDVLQTPLSSSLEVKESSNDKIGQTFEHIRSFMNDHNNEFRGGDSNTLEELKKRLYTLNLVSDKKFTASCKTLTEVITGIQTRITPLPPKIAEENVRKDLRVEALTPQAKIRKIKYLLQGNNSLEAQRFESTAALMLSQKDKWSPDYPWALYILERDSHEGIIKRHCLGYFQDNEESLKRASELSRNMIHILNRTYPSLEFFSGGEDDIPSLIKLKKSNEQRTATFDYSYRNYSYRKRSKLKAEDISHKNPLDEILVILRPPEYSPFSGVRAQFESVSTPEKIKIGSHVEDPGKRIDDIGSLIPGEVCVYYRKETETYIYVQIRYVDDTPNPPEIAYYDGSKRAVSSDPVNFFQLSKSIVKPSRETEFGVLLGNYGVPVLDNQVKAIEELQKGKVYLFEVLKDKYIYVEILNVSPNGLITYSDSGIMGSMTRFVSQLYHLGIVEPSIELEVDQEKIELLATRTKRMEEALIDYQNYNPEDRCLTVGNTKYIPLSSEVRGISSHPIASCGSSTTREVILLDPENSPVLNAKYQDLVDRLLELKKSKGMALDEEVVIKFVIGFIKESVFPENIKSKHHENIYDLINSISSDETIFKGDVRVVSKANRIAKVPFIPIDCFVQMGLGIYRHHALVLSYFLDRLTKETKETQFLSGVVQHMRSNVERGAHSWVIYVNKQQQFHVDSLWDIFKEFSSKNDQESLINVGYGQEAIELQVKRVKKLKKELKK